MSQQAEQKEISEPAPIEPGHVMKREKFEQMLEQQQK